MNAQLKMLLWKEWRERRWQFLLCLLWVFAPLAPALISSTPFWCSWVALVIPYSLLMPIFVAMRTAPAETSDRQSTFAAGLPIPARRQGWIRLVGGWITLMLPLWIGAAIFALFPAPNQTDIPAELLTGGGWGDPHPWTLMLALLVAIPWITTGLYLLLCLLGTVVRGELRLGLMAGFFAILWGLNFCLGFPEYRLARVSPTLALCSSAVTPNTPTLLAYSLAVRDFTLGRRDYGVPDPFQVGESWPFQSGWYSTSGVITTQYARLLRSDATPTQPGPRTDTPGER